MIEPFGAAAEVLIEFDGTSVECFEGVRAAVLEAEGIANRCKWIKRQADNAPVNSKTVKIG